MNAPTDSVIRVPGPDNPNRCYVEIVLVEGSNRVLVKPGLSAGRLPRLWPQWLRQLAMAEQARPQKTAKVDRRGYRRPAWRASRSILRVDIRGEYVHISCPHGRALVVAQRAAAQLRPMPEPALERTDLAIGNKFETTWRVTNVDIRQAWDDDIELAMEDQRQIMDGIRLPRGCRVDVTCRWRECVLIRLVRTRTCRISQAELAQRVELHYMLRCAQRAAVA